MRGSTPSSPTLLPAGEKGANTATGHCIVAVDPRCFRPTEVETLLGDPTKAREKLGWVPDVNFADVVREMIWAISVPRVGATMPRRPAPELLLPRWR